MSGKSEKMDAVKEAAERFAEVIAKAETDWWELGVADEEILEDLKAAAFIAKASISTGDYDQFKYACALVTSSGVIPGDRSKWAVMEVAGDIVWRVNRDMMSRQIEKDVDRFLADVFPEG